MIHPFRSRNNTDLLNFSTGQNNLIKRQELEILKPKGSRGDESRKVSKCSLEKHVSGHKKVQKKRQKKYLAMN